MCTCLSTYIHLRTSSRYKVFGPHVVTFVNYYRMSAYNQEILQQITAGGCGSVDPGSRRGRGGGSRCCPVHAATLDTNLARLEAPAEGTTTGGVPRVGGDYTETPKVFEVEEGDHIGLRSAGSIAHAPDSHAGERCGKRLRTSPP